MSSLILLLVLAMAATGCAAYTYTAPRDWLPMPNEVQKETYGAWLHLRYVVPRETQEGVVEGEFIAYADSALYLISESGVTRVPIRLVTVAQVEIHDYSLHTYRVWTIVGMLSTFPAGMGAILAVPLWAVAGTISAVVISEGGQLYEQKPAAEWWEEASRFARFPQGLPRELNLQDLRPKR